MNNNRKLRFLNFFIKGNNERTVKINENVFIMFLLKGVNIVISLMYVPLLINSMSPFRYGIWLTITSILTWLNFFDIGLGNGLRNKLSESIAQENVKKSKYLISTAYFFIALLSIFFNGISV